MARPQVVKDAKRFCLNLPEKIQSEGATLARTRYGISFSMLVARLLVKEKQSKKGLVHAHPREISA